MLALRPTGCAPKPALRTARAPAPRRARAAIAARAEKDTKPSKESSKQEENVRKAVEAMKKDGVDPKVARKVLAAWKEKQGIEGGKDLRGNVTKFGVSVVALAGLQLVTDIIASYCANQTAVVVGFQQFTGHGVLAIVLQTLSYYFAINAGLDVFRLGTVIGGTFVMGTRADTLYQAIEELAGEQGSINIVNKVEAAVSTSKVALALNSVRKALQDEMSDGQLDLGTLDTLTSYFVLQNAEAEYGWTPEKAGLTVDQANEAAAAFNKFDNNDDYRLEMSEFKRLCDAADFDLTDAEVKKAVEMLDKRASGYIEFDEFAAWWVEKEGGSVGGGGAASNSSEAKTAAAST